MRGLFAGCCALVVGACDYAPEVGAPTSDRCVNADSDPSTSVSFQRDIVQGIVMTKCLPCHAPDGENNVGIEVGGLDLTSHAGLMKGGVNGGADIVIPGQPCDSVLVQKASAGPPFGNRMPFDGPPFLDAAERQRVSDWIAEGAQDQ